MRWTLVPAPGGVQVPGMLSVAILQAPAFMFVGAYPILMEKREVKPVMIVGFVIMLVLSSGVNVVTLISGSPTMPTAWWQTRFAGGELLDVVFQSPWNTVLG